MRISDKMLRAVQAVETFRDSRTRIFMETPLTFFSVLDEWLYIEISDTRLCETCRANALMENGVYNGNRLRLFFPYLEILDEDTIAVNEHPNCRCVLVRIAKAEELFKKIVFEE
jgi:hypothetical protein